MKILRRCHFWSWTTLYDGFDFATKFSIKCIGVELRSVISLLLSITIPGISLVCWHISYLSPYLSSYLSLFLASLSYVVISLICHRKCHLISLCSWQLSYIITIPGISLVCCDLSSYADHLADSYLWLYCIPGIPLVCCDLSSYADHRLSSRLVAGHHTTKTTLNMYTTSL